MKDVQSKGFKKLQKYVNEGITKRKHITKEAQNQRAKSEEIIQVNETAVANA